MKVDVPASGSARRWVWDVRATAYATYDAERMPARTPGVILGAMPTPITRYELRAAVELETVTVVDALPAAPYRRRHLPGALNLTAEDAGATAGDVLPDRGAAIVTYSTNAGCGRGEVLAERLEALGYTDVRVYCDGIEDWVSAGLPVAAAAEERTTHPGGSRVVTDRPPA